MRERSGELVAADEPTIITESLPDAIVVEDGQSGARLADSAGPDESEWGEVFRQADDLLDQLAAAKVGPRRWGWRFSNHARYECKALDLLVVGTTDLLWIWVGVSILSVMQKEHECHLPGDFDCQYPHEFLAWSDACQQLRYGYS